MAGKYLKMQFALFGLLIFLSYSLAFSQAPKNSKPGKSSSIPQLSWSGAFSSFFDSLSCDMLNQQVWELLDGSDEFAPVKNLEGYYALNQSIQKTKNPEKIFRENLLADTRPQFFLTLEKKGDFFVAIPYILKSTVANIRPIDTLFFVSDIKKNIRRAAPHIIGVLKKHYSLVLPKIPTNPVFQFNQPLLGVLLTEDGLVIKKDSITHIYNGQTLISKKDFSHYPIQTEKFSHILYPGSAYTFHSPSLIELNQGDMGIIQLEFPLNLLTPALNIKLKKAILKLSISGDRSVLNVFAGEVLAQTILGEDKKTIPHKTRVESYGQKMKTGTISDSAFVVLLDPFKKQLTPQVFRHFKNSKRIMEIAPNHIVDYFHADASDPMDYFMAEQFNDLGIDMEALELEGESWKINTTLIKNGIDETGCYLCIPGDVMAP